MLSDKERFLSEIKKIKTNIFDGINLYADIDWIETKRTKAPLN